MINALKLRYAVFHKSEQHIHKFSMHPCIRKFSMMHCNGTVLSFLRVDGTPISSPRITRHSWYAAGITQRTQCSSDPQPPICHVRVSESGRAAGQDERCRRGPHITETLTYASAAATRAPSLHATTERQMETDPPPVTIFPFPSAPLCESRQRQASYITQAPALLFPSDQVFQEPGTS